MKNRDRKVIIISKDKKEAVAWGIIHDYLPCYIWVFESMKKAEQMILANWPDTDLINLLNNKE